MKKRKKLLKCISGIITISIVMSSLETLVQADEISNVNTVTIGSEEISSDVINYATDEFNSEVNIIGENIDKYSFSYNEFEEAYLGNPFVLYSYENQEIQNSGIYYFPLISNDEIIAFFIVSESDDSEYTTTFSESFAEELNEVIENNNSESLQIVSVYNNIYAIDNENESVLLADLSVSEDDKNELVSDETLNQVETQLDNLESCNEIVDVDISEELTSVDEVYGASSTSSTVSYNYLKMSIVYQGAGCQWCASAACATILNYKLGYSLTAEEVAAYIQGTSTPDPEVGCSVTDVATIYDHYGYNVTFVDDTLSYTSVVLLMALDRPVNALTWDRTHSTVTYDMGHSMVIAGYYAMVADEKYYYFVIDPNFDDGYFLVSADSDTGVYTYTLGTYKFTWERTYY